MFSCNRIICSVFISRWQVFKYHFHCFHSKTIRVICCHDRYICLDRMCHNINTGCTCQSFWGCHCIVNIYDCHIRKQFVVSNRPFYTSLCICDDRERCHLRSCSRRCRNCYKICLLSHFRECKYSLTNIHEIHCHVFKVCFRMFIHHPHNLSGIHCRSTTECDDRIRLKCAHLVCTFLCTL